MVRSGDAAVELGRPDLGTASFWVGRTVLAQLERGYRAGGRGRQRSALELRDHTADRSRPSGTRVDIALVVQQSAAALRQLQCTRERTRTRPGQLQKIAGVGLEGGSYVIVGNMNEEGCGL